MPIHVQQQLGHCWTAAQCCRFALLHMWIQQVGTVWSYLLPQGINVFFIESIVISSVGYEAACVLLVM